jgi:hypothetical protein
MKTTLLTIALAATIVVSKAQTPTSIYSSPYGNTNSLSAMATDGTNVYALCESTVDVINTTTSVATKLFDKPWTTNDKFDHFVHFNGNKAIVGQIITTPSYRQLLWMYNGISFDTLFSVYGYNQNITIVTAGAISYIYNPANKNIYKTNYTTAGTSVIANIGANIVPELLVFNNALYFSPLPTATPTYLKKYDGTTLTTIEQAIPFDYGLYNMKVLNNNLYYAHTVVSNASLTKNQLAIHKIDASNTNTLLYNDTNKYGHIQVRSILGLTNNQLLVQAYNAYQTKEFIYKLNATTPSTPTQLLTQAGSALVLHASTPAIMGNYIYLDASDDTVTVFGTNSNRKIWITDGTQAGTKPGAAYATTGITEFTGAGYSNVENWFTYAKPCGNKIITLLKSTNGYIVDELWSYDGDTPPVNIATPNFKNVFFHIAAGGNTFAIAQNQTNYGLEILKVSNCSATNAIEDISNINKITIYPNPSNGAFTIANSSIGTTLTIVDIAGKQVCNTTLTATAQHINTVLNAGVYFVKVGNNKVQKLIVE